MAYFLCQPKYIYKKDQYCGRSIAGAYASSVAVNSGRII